MAHANKTYDEIAVGDGATITRVLSANDLLIFAHASGNFNPIHIPDSDDSGAAASEVVAPSMWAGSLISAVLGNVLPGPGTLYKKQLFEFLKRVHVGDELSVTVTVREKLPDNIILLDTKVAGHDGELIADGYAEVFAPVTKIVAEDTHLPGLSIARHAHFDRLIHKAAALEPLRVAVVAPEAEHALNGALEAAEQGIIAPVLIGDPSRIADVARTQGRDITGYELVGAANADKAAASAVELVHAGRVDAIMKGHLHTDVLLRHIVKKDGGLRGSRRLSHVFVMDVPGLKQMLLVSDAAINISPGLEDKVDITQNAINLALSLGIKQPKVGVLSAVGTVTPKIPSTLDAAVLSKMAERGQIAGGVVDGPLAMDNAVDVEAAKTKGIVSLVAGKADILIAPNIEAGNMLAKELTFIAHADGAGIVLGAQAPIILTSRADGEKARLASCAIASLYRAWQDNSGSTNT